MPIVILLIKVHEYVDHSYILLDHFERNRVELMSRYYFKRIALFLLNNKINHNKNKEFKKQIFIDILDGIQTYDDLAEWH